MPTGFYCTSSCEQCQTLPVALSHCGAPGLDEWLPPLSFGLLAYLLGNSCSYTGSAVAPAKAEVQTCGCCLRVRRRLSARALASQTRSELHGGIRSRGIFPSTYFKTDSYSTLHKNPSWGIMDRHSGPAAHNPTSRPKCRALRATTKSAIPHPQGATRGLVFDDLCESDCVG